MRPTRHAVSDPGDTWADVLLAPLRRQEIACDVSGSVMTRIGAAQPTPLVSSPLRRPRLAITLCLLGGTATLGVLLATLVALVLAGDPGIRQIEALTASAFRSLILLGDYTLGVLEGLVIAMFALLRGLWVIVEAAAPILQGAGMMAALSGVLSILISLYLIANAYRTAPISTAGTELRDMGGIR